MGTILAYIFASAICLAVLLSVYKITLAEKKQPGFNRAVLLAILAASFVIPFIWDVAKVNPVATEAEAVMPESMVVSGDDISAESEPAEYSIPVDAPETADPVAVTAPTDYSDIPAETVVAENPLPVAEDGRHSPAWLGIIVLLWCIGSLVALAYTLVSLAMGFVALARGKKVMVNGARCVLVEGRQDTPYAFWGHIFLSDRDMDEKSEMVMLHELSHLRHRHGVDLLIARSVTILQWWNPFAWMLLVELHAVHEYQADGDVLLENGVDEKRYQYLLVERAAARSRIVNHLGHHRLIVAEIKLVADAYFSRRFDKNVPQLIVCVKFTKQKHFDAGAGLFFVTIKKRREDLGVIKDHNISLIEILKNFFKLAVFNLAGIAMENHHACLVAVRHRILGYEIFG